MQETQHYAKPMTDKFTVSQQSRSRRARHLVYLYICGNGKLVDSCRFLDLGLESWRVGVVTEI
jgi:hypothetical protein